MLQSKKCMFETEQAPNARSTYHAAIHECHHEALYERCGHEMREVQGEDSPIEHGKIQPKCCGKFCATLEAVLVDSREDSVMASRQRLGV